LDSKKSKAHVAKRNQIHRGGIFHREWKQGLGKHASGRPWQDQHQPVDILPAFHTPRADDGIKKSWPEFQGQTDDCDSAKIFLSIGNGEVPERGFRKFLLLPANLKTKAPL
jgi:hypothetical protein